MVLAVIIIWINCFTKGIRRPYLPNEGKQRALRLSGNNPTKAIFSASNLRNYSHFPGHFVKNAFVAIYSTFPTPWDPECVHVEVVITSGVGNFRLKMKNRCCGNSLFGSVPTEDCNCLFTSAIDVLAFGDLCNGDIVFNVNCSSRWEVRTEKFVSSFRTKAKVSENETFPDKKNALTDFRQ